MSATAFDTYAAAKTLREAGFDERQAEATVAVMRDAVTEGVATRADVARLEDKIDAKADKADVARLETRIAELKVTMLLAMVALAGGVVAAIKLLPPAGTP